MSAGPEDPSGDQAEKLRYWLTYPQELVKSPVVWEVGRRFHLTPNIRQASVTHELGIVCLELSGRREDILSAVRWMEEQGIVVEPVEINVIDS